MIVGFNMLRMRMMLLNRIFCAIMLASLLPACRPDDLPASMDEGVGNTDDRVAVSLEVNGIQDSGAVTKSPVLEGSEEIMSGAFAYVYYSDTGLLDSVQELSADLSSTTVSLPLNRNVDIYVLGNLWAISKAGNKHAELSEAMGSLFPSSSDEFSEYVYRMDGGSLNDMFRRESIPEAGIYGIPFSGEIKGFSVGVSGTVSVGCQRLFSKISLTIDHDGLEAGSDRTLFRNVKLHIRQANCLLRPFGNQVSKAVSVDDVTDGDYDPSMVNSSSVTFDFYVPENMQGDLLAGNSDQRNKTRENIVARWGEHLAEVLTYVEFTGEIDPSAGGYGGEVVYRFYLGKDAVCNFDIERNRRYDVTLGFRVNSLFDPYWQVDADLRDGRSIGIAADGDFSRILPHGQMVAVRRNRPGRLFVYIDTGGVLSKPSSLRDADYNPGSLAENALTTDFLSETNRPDHVPCLAKLLSIGITPSYDAATGRLSFDVTDPSVFRPGEEIELTLNTVPKGKSCSILLRTYDNMSETWEKPLSQKLYEGASNCMELKGYAGEVAVMSSLGIFKFAPTPQMNSDFVPRMFLPNYCRTQGGKMRFYRFYGGSSGSIATVSIKPVDTFNDGSSERSFNMALGDAVAYLDLASSPLELDIAGSPERLVIHLRDALTKSTIPRSSFDDEIFDLVYGGQGGLPDLAGELSDSHGPCVALERTGEYSADGYPEYRIFRSRIGDRFRTRGAKSVNDVLCSLEYQYKGYCDIYDDGTRAVLNGRRELPFTLRLLPFMSDPGDLGLSTEYDDYTLWKSDKLDAGYCSGNSSNPYLTASSLSFYLNSADDCELYAKPLAESSYATLQGRSPNIRVTHTGTSGPLKMEFFDDGKTTLHSAGPHELCARVENRHSGEVLEEVLGEFDVFVHFLVGLSYDSSSIVLSSDKSILSVYPLIVSDISRTSYGDSRYNTIYADGYSVRVLYTGDTYEQNFQIPVGSGYDYCRIRPTLTGDRRIGASMKPSSGNYFQTYEIIPQSSYDSVPLMSFLQGLSDPASPNHQRLAYNLGRNSVGLQFANPLYWDDGDMSASKGSATYDRTAFGDLQLNPGAMRGDDDYMKGYYVFHRLGDVKIECADWIPYFNWLAR